MSMIGLNLSDSSVEVVELTTGWFGQARITAQKRLDLAEGLVDNGLIHHPVELAKTIQHLVPAGEITLSIPEAQVYSRWLRFPANTKEHEIKQTIQSQCSQYVPFEASEVALDFIFSGQQGDQQDVLLLAIPVTVLKGYQELATALHCRLKRLELESLSSARAALGALPTTGAMLLLDVGARTTIASWFTKSGLRFSFNIPLAGRYFTEQVQKALKTTPLEAERLKQRFGFETKTNVALEEAWQPIIKAVNEAISYLQLEAQLPTTAVTVIGGSALLPGLVDWLHDQWKLPVALPNKLPWQQKYGMVAKSNQEEGTLMLNAVGLVLGELKPYRDWPTVNFINSIVL
ncbi:MAG: pilus assembly protein PilM [Candidatus Kerfeldbacteria bacterium]|nr:pilus assembly protein PilM [Candidatus Kerfeldbacteria bacterium]